MKYKCLVFLMLAPAVGYAAGVGFRDLPLQIEGVQGRLQSKPGWDFGVGASLERAPEYHGSGKSSTEIQPYVGARYRSQDERWEFQTSLLDNRFRYRLSDRVIAHAWLNFEEGRKESDASDGSLKGMGKISNSAEFGGGLTWLVTDRWSVSAAAQTYAKDSPSKGVVGFLATHYRLIDSERFTLDVGGDVSYATGAHLQAEFGVTPAQAARSGYRAYSIPGGLKSYAVDLSGVYQFDKRWSLNSSISVERLGSKSAKSPLIRAGSKTETELEVGLMYRF